MRDIAAVLFAAEAVGVAQWCVDTAAEYAKVRVQFGRPIGQFQGVKHRCADMLARTELARAAAWDAARAADDLDDPARRSRSRPRPRSRSTPRSLNGKDCVQTLGGIGFTWEHDAHIYLRRAMTLHQLTGTPDDWRVRAARGREGGARRRLAVDLPAPKPRRTAPSCARSSTEIKDLAAPRAARRGSRPRATSRRAGPRRGAATPRRSSCSSSRRSSAPPR